MSCSNAWRVPWKRKLSSSTVSWWAGQWQSTLSPWWSMFVRGRGEAVLVEQHEEPVLEFAEGRVAGQRVAQRRNSLLVRVAGDAGLDFARPGVVLHPRLVTHPRELLLSGARCEVEQHARHRRDWDALEDRAVEGVQAADTVDRDARPAAARERRHSHLRPRGSTTRQAQQVRGRVVAEHRALAACKHRGLVRAEDRWRAVPDRIDAVMDAMQKPVADPSPNAMLAHPGLAKLRGAHAAMLRGPVN
jgi:hypothetical protein